MTTWQTTTFKERLEELGMSPVCEGEEWSGLELVANLEQVQAPSARIALESADHYGADAVFFRQFPQPPDRSPLPQIYIYNRMQRLDWSPHEFGEIQRRLWNAEIVPLAVVLTTDAVRVFSCRKEPKLERGNQFHCQWFEQLETALAAEKLLLKHAVESGTLWEDPKFADAFSFEGSAHHKLLDNLRHFKTELLASNELPPKVATRVLVLVILLKYLEDRTDTYDRGVFPPDFVTRLTDGKADRLAGLFRIPGACIALFESLSDHFNGGIFALTEEERQHLQTADLSPVAKFMKGTQETSGQQVFWPLYSFEDLPVELVSNIYEEFLAKDGKDRGGIVYTSPILAELLLDETLPLDTDSLNWRILDPACGSGIFLVGAFRRLVQCWRMANGWRQPGHNDLKAILRNNIFGCDLEPEAVLVAVFSLCVALCDELDPKVIWEELQFDDLQRENLRAIDFFEFVEDKTTSKDFDLIIGNPPFKKLSTQAEEDAEKRAWGIRPPLPDKQLALLFMDQAFAVCRTGGTVCLIQPAGPLLYNVQARDFRNHIIEAYDVRAILDFTPLESVLFRANVATAAIIVDNRTPERDELLHAIFRRTRSTKDRLLMEVDFYDLHWLGREYVQKNPFAWKVNLLGGGRLHRMVQRFAAMPTLGDFLSIKEKNCGWVVSEGCKGIVEENDDLPDANWLAEFQEFRFLPTEAFTENGIDDPKLTGFPGKGATRTRKSKRLVYHPPHLLVKKLLRKGRIPVEYRDDGLVFRDQIIGIHAPEAHMPVLRTIGAWLNEGRFGAFWATVTGTKSLVKRATSYQKSDLMALPFPEHREEMTLFDWEKELVADVLDLMIEFRHRGEKALAVKLASQKNLQDYAATYCGNLNAIYKEFQALKPILFGGAKNTGKDNTFVCYPFCYGEEPQIDLPSNEEAASVLQELCHRQHGPRLFVNRIIRLYEKNVILMIKPNQKRFWLRSVAMRDADETVAELIEAGY